MKDYLLLFDKNERLKRIINSYEFFKDEYKITVSGEVTFEFKIKDNVTDINKEDKIGVFNKDGSIDLLIVDQVESETIYSTEFKVTCLHDFYSIQDQKVITQWQNEAASLRESITYMLEGTSYELGECVERALNPLGPYLYKNVLWCIQDILKVFEVEVYYSVELDSTRTMISKKKLNIVNALGSDTGIRCSTDLNVSKIKSIQKSKFYTVLYGCGSEYQKDLVKYKYDFKDIESTNPYKPLGKEYVEDAEAIAKYGRKIGIFEDGRVKEPELLLKKTWEALKANNRPIVSYELELQELKFEDGYEHLNFKLGDLIILQNTTDGSRAKFRIVEYSRQVSNPKNVKVTVGEQIRGLTSGGGSSSNGNIIDPGDNTGDLPTIEDYAPDTLPTVPVVEAQGLWSMVRLSWSYENKMYYNYEVYASKINNFEPTVFNMIFSGQASSYLHEVLPGETWYYKVRAINSHGSTTDFSIQIEASTAKLSDAAKYFEEAAISDALIGNLRLDRGWVGKLVGEHIDARNLTVTDGNGKKTLYIDSFGNINIIPTNFKILVEGKEEGVVSQSQFEQNNNSVEFKLSETGGKNYIRNSQFKRSFKFWYYYLCTLVNIGNVPMWLDKFNKGTGLGIKNTSSWQVGTLYSEDIPIESNNYYSLSMDGYLMSNVKGAELWIEEKREDKSIIYSHFVGHVKNEERFGGTIHVTNNEANYITVVVKHLGVKEEGAGNDVVYVNNFKLEQGDHITNHSQHQEEIYANNVLIDKDGLTIHNKNGAMVNMGSEEFSFSDDTGNKSLGINGGGLTFHTTDIPEYVGFIKPVGLLPNDNKYNGVALVNTDIGDFIVIGHNADVNESATQFKSDILIVNRPIVGIGDNREGIYIYNLPFICKTESFFDERVTHQNETAFNRQLIIRSNEDGLPHVIHTHNEDMAMYGHRGVSLGIRANGNFYKGLRLVYAGDYSNKCYSYVEMDMDFKNQYFIRNAHLLNCTIHNTIASGYLVDVENDVNVLIANENITEVKEDGTSEYEINAMVKLLYEKIHKLEKEVEQLKMH